MERILRVTYDEFADIRSLPEPDGALVEAAREAAARAVAPHSNFSVGAAARLAGGAVVTAANVESEVYPAGICAERNLLFHIATQYPDDAIESFAVVSPSTPAECYPCGLCRQSLLDGERRQSSPIRVIMAGADSATVVASAASLLPFGFKLPE